MTTSLKSDFYLLRGYLKSLLGVYFFMIVIAFIQKNTFIANFYPAFLAIYMPYTLFSLGQQSGWETMLLSAPVSRKGLVGGRYAMCLAVDLGMLLIGFGASSVIEPDAIREHICALLFTLAFVIVLNAVLLPVIYQFGITHARFVILAICLIPALALPLSEVVDLRPMAEIFTRMLTSIPALLVLCISALVFLALSYLLSCAIYRRKEF